MVYSETTHRMVPSFLQAGRQWILNSISNQRNPNLGPNSAVEGQPQQQETEEEVAASSTEYLVHNWLEALFSWFQVIVLWHEPVVSLWALTSLLTSFLLLTYFAPSFYATIMIVLIIYNANKYWFRYVWPSIRVPPGSEREEELRLDVDRWTYLHPQLMTLAELNQHYNNLKKIGGQQLRRFLEYRQDKPVAFCSVICFALSCTAYIGNRLDGLNLIFLSTTALVLAPGIYLHLMPQALKDWLRQTIGLRTLNSVNRVELSSESSSSISSGEQLTQSPQLEIDSSGKNDPLSSLSSRAKSIETQALSLLEHFKRASFRTNRQSSSKDSSSETKTGEENTEQCETPTSASNTAGSNPSLEQPELVRLDNQKQQQSKDDASGSHLEPSRGSDEMSSNDSVSLFDSDDDQEGFVML